MDNDTQLKFVKCKCKNCGQKFKVRRGFEVIWCAGCEEMLSGHIEDVEVTLKLNN